MLKKIFTNRYVIMALTVMALFGALMFRLYNLQITDAGYYAELADVKKGKTLAIKGSRGRIMDVNGLPLAYDRRCFDVEFYRDPSRKTNADRAAYTRSIIETMRIVERSGSATIDGFSLVRDENGQWAFDFGNVSAAVAARREELWRGNFYLRETPVEELFDQLCTNYNIPPELTEGDKLKVLSIWQEVQMNAFLPQPVKIARDVPEITVMEIEVRALELTGASIAESTTRVYPRGELACHVIGYIGKIGSDAAMKMYLEKKYAPDDLVGISGIESSMEDQLTPNIEYRQGMRVVERNMLGKIVRELSYKAPINGNDIMLTIDSGLQQVVEDALDANIKQTYRVQIQLIASEKWQIANRLKLEERPVKPLNLADSGACVVMDPNTGRIMAMASNPGFDLTAMMLGTDREKVSAILSDSRTPLFNRAISAKDTPGSIYKLVTAIGGLIDGYVTVDESIDDEGPFDLYEQSNPPKCWISPYFRSHAQQSIVEAIKNSCNYYFFTVASRMGSIELSKWASLLGLTSRTGIELPGEASGFVGSQPMLYDMDRPIANQYTSKPAFAAAMIRNYLTEMGKQRGIEYDAKRLDAVVKKLLDTVVIEPTKETWSTRIRSILVQDMNFPTDFISNRFMVNQIYYYLNDLKWTGNETIMTAIGQSITQVTPIAVARYISAIANGGTVYDAQIIDKILSPEGDILFEKPPTISATIEGFEPYLPYIKEGMNDVTSQEDGGTAGGYFTGCQYKDVICAKTGTAQGAYNIDVENKSWVVGFAPINDPKIVVVVYMPNGYAGSRSSPTLRRVLEYYLDNYTLQTDDALPLSSALAQ